MTVITTLPSVAVVRVDVGVPPSLSRRSGDAAIIESPVRARGKTSGFPQLLAQTGHPHQFTDLILDRRASTCWYRAGTKPGAHALSGLGMREQQHLAGGSAVVHAEVGIIGAGPAGLATAVRLGQLGVDRVVLVDRADFPRDKTCGSAISPKGCAALAELGLSEVVTRESYAISGLRLVTPRGHDVLVASPQDVALICSRRTLDHLLLQRAQAMGISFLGNFEVSFLLQRGDRVVGFRSSDGREVRVDYTVVANGAHTRFACEREPRRLIQAIMGWWEGVPFRSHHVEMIFDESVAPYYGWLVPETP